MFDMIWDILEFLYHATFTQLILIAFAVPLSIGILWWGGERVKTRLIRAVETRQARNRWRRGWTDRIADQNYIQSQNPYAAEGVYLIKLRVFSRRIVRLCSTAAATLLGRAARRSWAGARELGGRARTYAAKLLHWFVQQLRTRLITDGETND